MGDGNTNIFIIELKYSLWKNIKLSLIFYIIHFILFIIITFLMYKFNNNLNSFYYILLWIFYLLFCSVYNIPNFLRDKKIVKKYKCLYNPNGESKYYINNKLYLVFNYDDITDVKYYEFTYTLYTAIDIILKNNKNVVFYSTMKNFKLLLNDFKSKGLKKKEKVVGNFYKVDIKPPP